MRPARLFLAASALTALAIMACAPSVDVRTLSAPDARFEGWHAFRMLPLPPRRDGRPGGGSNDPMVENSITSLALRQSIVQAFAERGYVLDDRDPDFDVAFYASARQKLDVTQWDYGYPYHPRWRTPLPPTERVTTYNEGSVVVDIVDARTHQLAWRGHGAAEITDEPREMMLRLRQVAVAVIGRFPRASAREIAQSRRTDP